MPQTKHVVKIQHLNAVSYQLCMCDWLPAGSYLLVLVKLSLLFGLFKLYHRCQRQNYTNMTRMQHEIHIGVHQRS